MSLNLSLRKAVVLFMLLLPWSSVLADTIAPPLPAEVTLNKKAGRGGWLILNIRIENGQELPFVVDTGSPITLLDPSLDTNLGKCLLLTTGGSPAGGKQKSGIYAAPKLFLGGVQLKTDTYVATYNLGKVKGLIGMDCLRHYCIQVDCQAGKLRFLEPAQVHPAELGKGFPLIFSSAGQHFPQMFTTAGQNQSVAMIHHAGLLGGDSINLLIDTGDNVDGGVMKGTLKGHYWGRFIHSLIKKMPVPLKDCVWDGKTYTKLQVVPNTPVNRLGMRFLARHLITFDFPNQTFYIKQISSNPLPAIN
jgi:hypothetical protein